MSLAIPPVGSLKRSLPIAVKNPLIQPECAVIDMTVVMHKYIKYSLNPRASSAHTGVLLIIIKNHVQNSLRSTGYFRFGLSDCRMP